MFDYLKKIITPEVSNSGAKKNSSDSRKIQIATAALFVEIGKADGNFSDEERKNVITNMKQMFQLDEECVEELLVLSEQQVKESVSVYEFSSVINEKFSRDDKYELIKNLWKIIYTDKNLNQYEDRLIKLIGATLNLEHKDIIDAKLEIKKEK